jgi:hypothetical protein
MQKLPVYFRSCLTGAAHLCIVKRRFDETALLAQNQCMAIEGFLWLAHFGLRRTLGARAFPSQQLSKSSPVGFVVVN